MQEVYDYYNSLREDFLNKLQIFLDKIEANPFIHSFVNEPIRQGKLKRFRYDVIYEIREEKMLVYSIFMVKQNPTKKRTT